MPPVVAAAAVAVGSIGVAGGIAAVSFFTLTGWAAVGAIFAVTAITGFVSQLLAPKFNAEDIGTQVNMAREPSAPREYVYGRARTGGTMLYVDSTGSSNETLWLNNAYADHEIDGFETYFLDDTELSFDGAGNATTSPYNGFLSRYIQTGSDSQAAVTQMTSALTNWTSNHRNRGLATIAWKLTYDGDVYPTGLPNPSVILRGRRLYDPRLDSTVTGGSGAHRSGDPATWAWSQNPVLCLLDYLRDDLLGPSIPLAAFEMSNVIAAANICDELVSAKGGGQLKRYTVNGIVNSQLSHGDVIELMTRSMGGTLTYSGGVFRFHPGAYDSPTVSFDEDDILNLEYTPAPSRRDLVNAVKGLFVDTKQAYQSADYPPQTNATYEAQDGDERFWLDLDLVFTHDHREAQRIAKLALESARRGGAASIRVNLRGLAARVWDTVQVTHANYGWTNKTFRVTGWQLNPPASREGGGGSDDNQGFTVDLTLKEDDPGVYAWNAATEEQDYTDPGDITLFAPNVAPDVINLAASAATFVGSDGSRQPAIKVTWDDPGPFVVDTIIQISADGGSTWLPYGQVDRSDGNSAIITGITRGTWAVRAVHRTTFWTISYNSWTTVTGIVVSDSTIAGTIVNQGDLAVRNSVNTEEIDTDAVTADGEVQLASPHGLTIRAWTEVNRITYTPHSSQSRLMIFLIGTFVMNVDTSKFAQIDLRIKRGSTVLQTWTGMCFRHTLEYDDPGYVYINFGPGGFTLAVIDDAPGSGSVAYVVEGYLTGSPGDAGIVTSNTVEDLQIAIFEGKR